MITRINNIFKLLIGILVIIFVFWNRLLRERVTKSISEMANSWPQKLLIIALLLLFLFQIKMAVDSLRKKQKESFYFKKLANMSFIQKIMEYLDSPKYLMLTISKSTSFKCIIETPLSYCVVFVNVKMLFFCLVLLPRFLVIVMFLIDIFIYGQFLLMYKALILLLIPFLTKLYFYIAEEFCHDYVFYIAHHLVFEESENGMLNVKPNTESPNIPNALALEIIREKFNVLVNHWEIYTNILNYIKTYKSNTEILLAGTNFIINVTYFFSWLYILIIAF